MKITSDIDSIKEVANKFKVIVLREPTNNKLILSCGNYHTSLRENNYCPRNINSHVEADTVDIDVFINPNFVADLSTSEFYDYLKNINKTYKEIIAEGGYTFHGASGLKKLNQILDLNGIYKLQVGIIINVINEDKLNFFRQSGYDDGLLSLTLEKGKYESLFKLDSKSIAGIIKEEMNQFYQKNGFTLQIEYPEFFTLMGIDNGSNPEISYQYLIERSAVEKAQIVLKR